jgi:excisionase family DNA binding protein
MPTDTTTDTPPGRVPRPPRPRQPGAPYTVAQAANALNLSVSTVKDRIRLGQLRAYKDGFLWRVAEADLDAYLAALRRASEPVAVSRFHRHFEGRAGRG